MYSIGKTYSAEQKSGSRVGAVMVESNCKNQLAAIPVGNNFVIQAGGCDIATFKKIGKRGKLAKRRTTVSVLSLHDGRRMRRYARQVLKMRLVERSFINDDGYEFYKHIARNYGK